jgi:hypothetical protein
MYYTHRLQHYPAGRLLLLILFVLTFLIAARADAQRHPLAFVFQTVLNAQYNLKIVIH